MTASIFACFFGFCAGITAGMTLACALVAARKASDQSKIDQALADLSVLRKAVPYYLDGEVSDGVIVGLLTMVTSTEKHLTGEPIVNKSDIEWAQRVVSDLEGKGMVS